MIAFIAGFSSFAFIISATAARPISGAVPAAWMSPSFFGGFGLWWDLTTVYVAVIVARFSKSLMNEFFSLITTCARADTTNPNTTRKRSVYFIAYLLKWFNQERHEPADSLP